MSTNKKLCPFCKRNNSCQANIENTKCWCFKVKIPKDLIALIPKELQMKSCICQNCVEAYKEDKEKFLKEINPFK